MIVLEYYEGDSSSWLVIVLLVLAAIIYFVPAIHAHKKHHHNEGAIFALNLLLGWTLLGWVGALVWASTNSREPVLVNVQQPMEPDRNPTKTCPHCISQIPANASVCRFCQRDVPISTAVAGTPSSDENGGERYAHPQWLGKSPPQ